MNGIAQYSTDEHAILYAHWSQFGHTTQYDPVGAERLTYNGKQQLLIDITHGHGLWRVNAPTDGVSNSYTYWYSKAETNGYVEGTAYNSKKTANEGYIADLKTDCTPLYETNAGTYTVYWNWNHQAGGEKLGMLTVTIDQKSINDTTIDLVSDAVTFTYDGNSHAPAITITDAAIGTDGTALKSGTDYSVEYEGTDTTDYAKSPNAPVNVGTYKAIITGTGNYKDTKEIEFTISKAEINVTVSMDDWTYGEAAKTPVETGNTVNGKVSYTYAVKGSTEFSETVPSSVGEYTVKASIVQTDNYNGSTATADFKIAKKTLAITADSKEIAYGAEDVELTYKVTGLANGDTADKVLTGAIEREAGTDAGTYKITQGTLKANDNYTIVFTGADYVINKNADINTLAINAGFKVTQKGSKITIKWGKVDGAEGYEVYVQYCGKNFSKTPAKRTTTKTSAVVTKIGGKKINLKKNFKVYVVAVKKDGDKNIQIAKSMTGHIVGRKNTKYTNVKSINLTTKTISVAAGKTSKIKAKTVLVNKKKKQLSDAHASEFRYASSDESIATVDKSGKVTGVSAGTCTVYVYARNGYAKTVSVTVK